MKPQTIDSDKNIKAKKVKKLSESREKRSEIKCDSEESGGEMPCFLHLHIEK